MRDIVIRAYSRDDMADISGILKHVGWEDFYVEGQQKAIQKLVKDEEGQAFVATVNGVVVGYVVVQHHSWNRLSQLQGLCVSMRNRRMGVAKHLVGRAEHESLNRGCRGIYVDTPVDNKVADHSMRPSVMGRPISCRNFMKKAWTALPI